MKKVKKAIITGRRKAGRAVNVAQKVMAKLKQWGVDYEVTDYFPAVEEGGRDINEIKNADMVLCFGGDGSFLRTFQRLKKPMPVLGINCGNRGYLLALDQKNVLQKLQGMLSGKYSLEERTRIKVFVDGKEAGQGLNEAIIVPQLAGRLLNYRLIIDGKKTGQEADDGIIVATPSGSTAHSLSAGGPRIMGNAKVFVIVRMNPLDLNRRPLVINDHSVIQVDQLGSPPVQVIIDGQMDFLAQKEVRIEKGTSVQFVKPK